jgi:hypothetical protein
MKPQAQKDSERESQTAQSPPGTRVGWRSSTSLEKLRQLLLRKSLQQKQLRFLRKAGTKSQLKKR